MEGGGGVVVVQKMCYDLRVIMLHLDACAYIQHMHERGGWGDWGGEGKVGLGRSGVLAIFLHSGHA